MPLGINTNKWGHNKEGKNRPIQTQLANALSKLQRKFPGQKKKKLGSTKAGKTTGHHMGKGR